VSSQQSRASLGDGFIFKANSLLGARSARRDGITRVINAFVKMNGPLVFD
jgi:hypothetical protein